jgi:hypothetical protein
MECPSIKDVPDYKKSKTEETEKKLNFYSLN